MADAVGLDPDARTLELGGAQDVIAEGKSTTYDLGGTSGTGAFADAVIARLATVEAGR